MKIHLVVANGQSSAEQLFLIKAHTKAGAEKFVGAKFKPTVEARVPSQQELVDALHAGVIIEYAPGTEPPQPNPVSQSDHE